jgi:hypothetical protein
VTHMCMCICTQTHQEIVCDSRKFPKHLQNPHQRVICNLTCVISICQVPSNIALQVQTSILCNKQLQVQSNEQISF